MLHVVAPEKRRVEPGALLDLVVVEKIADEDMNDLLLVFVDIDDRRRVSNWSTLGKKGWGPHPRSWGRFRAAFLKIIFRPHWKARSNSKFGSMHPSPLRPTALSPQKQLPRWRPRDTPMPLELAARAAHRTEKFNHAGPPFTGTGVKRGPTCTPDPCHPTGP